MDEAQGPQEPLLLFARGVCVFLLVGLSFAEVECSAVFVSLPWSITLHFNSISSFSSPPSHCLIFTSGF